MRTLAFTLACFLALGFAIGVAITTLPHTHSQPTGVQQIQAIDPLIPPFSIDTAADPFKHDREALPHGHGENLCASGCAASRHPTAPLTADAFRQLLVAYQQSAPTANNVPLEKILFYGRQSRQHWLIQQVTSIDPLWRMVLDEELGKTHVLISLRILDESGDVRSALTNIRVPLDRRHVFTMHASGLQPLVTSGTVKRVGLDHLWTRL
jgi:hypothetical protein